MLNLSNLSSSLVTSEPANLPQPSSEARPQQINAAEDSKGAGHDS